MQLSFGIWNANGLSNHTREIEIFLNANLIVLYTFSFRNSICKQNVEATI